MVCLVCWAILFYIFFSILHHLLVYDDIYFLEIQFFYYIFIFLWKKCWRKKYWKIYWYERLGVVLALEYRDPNIIFGVICKNFSGYLSTNVISTRKVNITVQVKWQFILLFFFSKLHAIQKILMSEKLLTIDLLLDRDRIKSALAGCFALLFEKVFPFPKNSKRKSNNMRIFTTQKIYTKNINENELTRKREKI